MKTNAMPDFTKLFLPVQNFIQHAPHDMPGREAAARAYNEIVLIMYGPYEKKACPSTIVRFVNIGR